MQCAWDEEWGVLGYQRVLGILLRLTRYTAFLYGGDDKLKNRELNVPLDHARKSTEILERGRGSRDRSEEDRIESRKDVSQSNNNKNNDNNDNDNINNHDDGDDNANFLDNDRNNRKSDGDIERKRELKNEKDEAIELATQIIFAFHDSISPFLDNLWSVRNLQIKCLSNLFNSPNINKLKKDMVPIFLNLMCDFDIRNRIAVARLVRDKHYLPVNIYHSLLLIMNVIFMNAYAISLSIDI